MNRKAKVHLAFVLTAILVTAGCGGGGGGYNGAYLPSATATTTPPATTPGDTPVLQSQYDKFIAYLKEVVQTALDTAEPADVTAFDPPPVSDTAEPVALQ